MGQYVRNYKPHDSIANKDAITRAYTEAKPDARIEDILDLHLLM